MNFSEKLVFLRKEQKLSQEQLAEMLDVSRQSVSKWESQQTLPELGKIILLSKIFRVSTDELLRDDLPLAKQSGRESDPPQDAELLPAEETALEETVSTIYCTQCGKPNRADSLFCGYCGHSFQTSVLTQADPEAPSFSPQEVNLAYYQADLELKKQNLEESRKQTILQHRHLIQQEKEYRSKVKCPRCGSTSLADNKQGYGIGKGVVGAALFGPLGLVAGNIHAKKVIVTCLNCGHKFKI